MAEGGDLKEAIAGEGTQGVRNLVGKIQTGSGKNRKRVSHQNSGIILKPNNIIGKTVPQKALLKKKRIDSLGYY